MAVTKTIESLETLNEELNMLQQMQKVNFHPKKPENPPPSKFKNVVIVPDKRQDLLSQVFRPDHTLPTMTLEQWGQHLEEQDKEQKSLMEEQMREQQMEEANGKRKPKTEDEDDSDEKVKKDRDWDDWKDTHEKGAGNKNDHYFKRT